MILLWHGTDAVGICVFAAPAASLALRSRVFGLSNPRCRVALASLNQQIWLLQRVVLHPTYRGAGIAAQFVRRACALCPVDWIETLSAMGQANPFFERAGFVRVGTVRHSGGRHGAYSAGTLSAASLRKSRHSEPVYYLFDNRGQRSRER